MKLRPVVVGATGQIGRPLCHTLVRAGGPGALTDILIRGKRVVPARASALGYRFRCPAPDEARHDLLAQPGRTR